VEVGTLRGWISNNVVFVSGNLSGVPVVESNGEIIKPTFYLYQDRYILQSPRERSIALCLIEGDLEYIIAGRNRSASWYALLTECSGEEVVGWVPVEYGAVRTSGGIGVPVIP
jgi:hypothetical protein